MSERTPTPQVEHLPDIVWPDALNTWAAHLHNADPLTVAHIASDVEYLPPSPVVAWMRAAVDAEIANRQVTA